MYYRAHISAVLLMVLLFSSLPAQEFYLPQEKVDLGFSPSEDRMEMARMKAQSLERERDVSRYFIDGPVTNWQEYDITYYNILWRTEFATAFIGGEVGVYGKSTIAELDSVRLNLSDTLIVNSVYQPSGILSFNHSQNHLTVYLDHSYAQGEEFGFTVVYGGEAGIESSYFGPEGLYFSTWHSMPLISNLSEPYGSRNWWPCNDIPLDKADSIDIHIIVDNGQIATSNGILVSDTDNGDGTHTMHWKGSHPIVTYTVCLAIGAYVSWEDWYVYSPTDSMAIVNYVIPGYAHEDSTEYEITAEALAAFSDLFGQYPYIDEKYGHTMVNVFGMEHQNNTFLDQGLSKIEGIVVHELAHHWWGNWVTCRDWANIWLNEGFGTYCEALFYETKFGPGYYRAYMDDMQWSIGSGGSIYVTDTTDSDNIFGSLQYNKGAYVLHMLRHYLGDEDFFSSMRLYGETYAHQNAVTEDFRDVCESVSGLELDIFFQQWIYGIDWPDYQYSYVTRRAPDFGGWNTYIFLEQTQTTAPTVYVTPVDFGLWYGPGFGTYQIMNTVRQQYFAINTPYNPDSLKFDPQGWLLETHQEVPFEIHIYTESLSDGIQGEPYEDTIVVIAASEIFTIEITSGGLPQGWALDPTTGIISGTSYDTGYHAFTVLATDEVEPAFVDSIEFTIHLEDLGYGPGDANLDGEANVGDAVFLINHIFKGGPAPEVPNYADANADCQINVGDAVYLINYVFKSGPAPQAGCVE